MCFQGSLRLYLKPFIFNLFRGINTIEVVEEVKAQLHIAVDTEHGLIVAYFHSLDRVDYIILCCLISLGAMHIFSGWWVQQVSIPLSVMTLDSRIGCNVRVEFSIKAMREALLRGWFYLYWWPAWWKIWYKILGYMFFSGNIYIFCGIRLLLDMEAPGGLKEKY